MRRSVAVSILAGMTTLTAAADEGLRAAPPSTPGVGPTLDTADLAYRDHEGRGANAGVHADLERSTEGVFLRLLVSATGPTVEPPPGFEGRRGANIITAEELEMLATGRRQLRGVTVHPAPRDPSECRHHVVRYDRLPVRRLLPDGRIDHQALTRRHYPVELALTSRLFGDGVHTSTWTVDGEPRLRATVELRGLGGRILKLEALHPGAGDSSTASVRPQADRRGRYPTEHSSFVCSARITPPPVVDITDWTRRDTEGRWLELVRGLDEEPARAADWVQLLVEAREFRLLEWLAIYEPRSFLSLGVGRALQEAKAPGWIRVAVWNLAAADDHTRESAKARLLLGRPGEVLAWFEKHPEAATANAEALLRELREQGWVATDAGDALPPLDARQVFEHLRPTARVRELGDGLRAEPGVVYLHQVSRAIDGLTALDEPPAELLSLLTELTEHASERVRQRACLAFSRVPAGTPQSRRLVAILRDEGESAMVREAALLGVSYARHPDAYLTLHETALRVDHPAWKAAVSRLGDVGDGFSLALLEERIDSGEAKEFATREIERLRARVEGRRKESPGNVIPAIRVRLERAAWANVTCHELEGELVPWALGSIREHAGDPAVREHLEKLRASYAPTVVNAASFRAANFQAADFADPAKRRVASYIDRILVKPDS